MQRTEGSIAVPDREKIGMQDFRMETFLAVCRHLNYTRAAEELCITQPAVSQHIRFLEEQIENHRRYGLMLTDFPQQRSANLVLGTCLLFLLFMMSLSFLFFISGHASLWVLVGAGLFMLLILCASIKSFVCFFAGLKRERQLQKLKRRQ